MYKRLRRDIRKKYCHRAHESTSPKRVRPKTPYSIKYQYPHEVDTLSNQHCMLVGSFRSKCLAKQLRAGNPVRQFYHPHQEAY